jgi:hypothetical protein
MNYSIGLAVVAALAAMPSSATTIVENYTLNLSSGSIEGGFTDPTTGLPIEEYVATVPFSDQYSTLSLAPGDTYQLNVQFSGGALQVVGGGARQGETIALYAADNTTRFSFDLQESLLFTGVQGSLLQNPVTAEDSGVGGLSWITGPLQTLTTSQFSFSGFSLTVNPLQYDSMRGDGHLDTLLFAVSSGQVDVIPAPLPIPAAMWLLLSGLGGLAALIRR